MPGKDGFKTSMIGNKKKKKKKIYIRTLHIATLFAIVYIYI